MRNVLDNRDVHLFGTVLVCENHLLFLDLPRFEA